MGNNRNWKNVEIGNQVAEALGQAHEVPTYRMKAILFDFMDRVNKLQPGEKISFRGRGTFAGVQRKAKKGHNFHTGESVDIPACRVVRFILPRIEA